MSGGAQSLRGGLRVVATGAGGTTHLCAPGAATLRSEATSPAGETAPEPTSVFVARFTCGPEARTLHLRYDLFFDHDPYHASYTRLLLGDPPATEDSGGVVDRLPQSGARAHRRRARPRAALARRPPLSAPRRGAHPDRLRPPVVPAGAVAGRRVRMRTSTRRNTTAEAATPRQALGSTVAIVSAFTVAHSLTLITQVLHPGWLSTHWVEPAIALSVAYVGFENLVPRAPSGRWLLVFTFGLVHGLGFASVLRGDWPAAPRPVTALFQPGRRARRAAAGRRPRAADRHHLRPSLSRAFERWGLQLGSGLIGTFGTIWLVTRLMR